MGSSIGLGEEATAEVVFVGAVGWSAFTGGDVLFPNRQNPCVEVNVGLRGEVEGGEWTLREGTREAMGDMGELPLCSRVNPTVILPSNTAVDVGVK